MSDQFRNRNDETQSHGTPGKRLAKKTKPALTPAQAQKRKEKRIMVIMIVVAVVMVIAAAGVLLYNRWVKKPNLPPESGQSSGVPESEDPNADPTPEPTLNFDAIQPKVSGARKSKDIYTFLIFGSDVTSGLTDTMMIATYDITNQQATVMSLPRDTIVNNTGHRITDKKLNAVYNLWGQGDDGVTALKNEVSELVGFVPDYYIRIDWELVGEMVDAIGGVWFDNPYHMEYYDPYQDLNIYQEKGYRQIFGDDAMQIVRWRHNGTYKGVPIPGGGDGSDLSRLQVQHDFLKAVLKQTLQIQNVFRIGQLAELFGNRVDSDLSVENIFWFAQEAIMGGLQVDDVEFCTMPVASGKYYQAKYDTTYSFVYPIQSQLLTLINEGLNPYVEQVTIRQLDLMSQASDGSLRSSTGRLADPSVGVVQTKPAPKPDESDPVESDDPDKSDPGESGAPQGSAPVTSDPVTTDPIPVQTDNPPPATQPAEPDVPAGTGGDSTPPPAPVGAPGDGDWGDTSE